MITLDIPHVDTGHTTLTFDTADPAQVALAAEQINSMIRQGFTVFLESEGKTEKVTSFDATKGVYKIGEKQVLPDAATATAVAPPSGGCAAL